MKVKKRLLMVARNVVPSRIFANLDLALEDRARSVLTHLQLANGSESLTDYRLGRSNGMEFRKEFAEEQVRAGVREADAVLLGIDSPENFANYVKIAADECSRSSKPFGFLDDTFGGFRAEWLQPLLARASFLLVINQQYAQEAREKYPHLKVVVAVNPLWEEFFTPKKTREEARALAGCEPNEKLILSTGVKSAAVNILMWDAVIEFLSEFNFHHMHGAVRLAITCHPGDKTPRGAYEELAKYTRVPVVFPQASTSGLLPGADLVVAPSGSTIQIEAAYLRIPVMSLMSGFARRRYVSMFGSNDWGLAELGAAVEEDLENSVAALSDALNEEGEYDYKLRMNQERAFPKPEPFVPGTAIKHLAEKVAELVRELGG